MWTLMWVWVGAVSMSMLMWVRVGGSTLWLQMNISIHQLATSYFKMINSEKILDANIQGAA